MEFGLITFADMQVPHHMTMKSIELFGTQVVPAVKKALTLRM